MSDASNSPVRVGADENARHTILVWDAPVRVFHWLMVLSFAGAYITGESESWRQMHVTFGYTMAGLVAFRILWGLIGTRYARFSSFVRGPAAIARYAGALMHGRPERHIGHNPAGALAIVTLLTLTILAVAAGWATIEKVGGDVMEELHEVAANVMLAVVGLHVAGVFLSSWLHRENLIRAMISGRKAGKPADGVRHTWRSLAAIMVIVVFAYWWLQWQRAPVDGNAGDRPVSEERAGERDDD